MVTISIIPAVTYIIKYPLWNFVVAAFPMMEIVDTDITAFTISIAEYANTDVYISIINLAFCSLVMVSIALSLLFMFRDKRKGMLAVLIFLAGLCSRFIMGFSPTIYGSSMRTFSCMIICMIPIIAMIYEEYKGRISNPLWFTSLSVLAVLQMLDTKVFFSGLI